MYLIWLTLFYVNVTNCNILAKLQKYGRSSSNFLKLKTNSFSNWKAQKLMDRFTTMKNKGFLFLDLFLFANPSNFSVLLSKKTFYLEKSQKWKFGKIGLKLSGMDFLFSAYPRMSTIISITFFSIEIFYRFSLRRKINKDLNIWMS